MGILLWLLLGLIRTTLGIVLSTIPHIITLSINYIIIILVGALSNGGSFGVGEGKKMGAMVVEPDLPTNDFKRLSVNTSGQVNALPCM